MTRRAAIMLLAAVFAPAAARAQGTYYWHNLVAPSYAVMLSRDATSGDFAYDYTVTNGAGAQQRLQSLFMVTPVAPSSMAAPTDWETVSEPGSTLSEWYASGTVDPAWAAQGDGDLPSFLSEIKPAQTRSGFVVRSPCAASGSVVVYARGYNHVPAMDSAGVAPVGPGSWKSDAVVDTVFGPGDCRNVQDWGNRRPGTDGFMGMVNFVNGATLPAGPATIQLRFSRSGEQVDRASFHAELNRVDVTAAFHPNSIGDLAAIFNVGSSPLVHGKNVLLLSVDGIVPGTTRTGTDADRFTFTVP